MSRDRKKYISTLSRNGVAHWATVQNHMGETTRNWGLEVEELKVIKWEEYSVIVPYIITWSNRGWGVQYESMCSTKIRFQLLKYDCLPGWNSSQRVVRRIAERIDQCIQQKSLQAREGQRQVELFVVLYILGCFEPGNVETRKFKTSSKRGWKWAVHETLTGFYINHKRLGGWNGPFHKWNCSKCYSRACKIQSTRWRLVGAPRLRNICSYRFSKKCMDFNNTDFIWLETEHTGEFA